MYQDLLYYANTATAKCGGLLMKAINYAKAEWKGLVRYTEDGRYRVDNNAECNIRPLTVERKNSLFFGNYAKAEKSALYHTFIAICQMMGLSVLKYFKNLFAAITAGRTEYDNMLPMTLCVCRAA